MAGARPKLVKGAKALDFKMGKEHAFDLRGIFWAWPQYAKAYKTAADTILETPGLTHLIRWESL